MTAPRVWFITGSSSGFGRSMTELVLKNGDIAVATLRKPEVLSDLSTKYSADKLLVLRVDVSKQREIIDAFAKTKEAFGRLDVVFNNAGYNFLSEFEAVPDENAREIFEVNFWGAVNVTRQALKFFREVNKPGVGGRLLQMSSSAGIVSPAMIGFYSATKHALEAISESMFQELNPAWNIKITLIEPGAFQTDGMGSHLPQLPPHLAYDYPESFSVMVRNFMPKMVFEGDVNKGVQMIYKLSELPEPPLRLPLGKDALEAAKKKNASLAADTEKYASWSDDLKRE